VVNLADKRKSLQTINKTNEPTATKVIYQNQPLPIHTNISSSDSIRFNSLTGKVYTYIEYINIFAFTIY
jgi:hypothetical protein